MLPFTLNINREETVVRILWRIFRSVYHNMDSLRELVRWRHIWCRRDINVRRIIVSSSDWCPGHRGCGFPFVSEDCSWFWAGLSKGRCLWILNISKQSIKETNKKAYNFWTKVNLHLYLYDGLAS